MIGKAFGAVKPEDNAAQMPDAMQKRENGEPEINYKYQSIYEITYDCLVKLL